MMTLSKLVKLFVAKMISQRATNQQMAVLGIVVMILGFNPRKNPPHPYCRFIMAAAFKRPLTFLISACSLNPLVCNSVLMASSGVVSPAAKAPARPPATQCEIGSYSFRGFMTLDKDS